MSFSKKGSKLADEFSAGGSQHTGNKGASQADAPHAVQNLLFNYFVATSPEYATCTLRRQQGRFLPAADASIEDRRPTSIHANDASGISFYKKMLSVAGELNLATKGLVISRVHYKNDDPHRILDLGTAPGAFLQFALGPHKDPSALAFTLPESGGGLKMHIPQAYHKAIKLNLVDVTLLAHDMRLPQDLLDGKNAQAFLPKHLANEPPFDLVVCDGRLSSEQQDSQAAHGDTFTDRESDRLLFSQLVLGLEYMRPGGTMIMFLNKLDNWQTARVVTDFIRICGLGNVQLFKPKAYDQEKSSFYLVAKGFKDKDSGLTEDVLKSWKLVWAIATHCEDDAYLEAKGNFANETFEVLKLHADAVAKLGGPIWKRQADALGELAEKASKEENAVQK